MSFQKFKHTHLERYYTPNTTQIDLTTHHNFTCSIPPLYMNIGDCCVQRLRTTWEYTKRHRSPPLLHTVTSHLLEATSGDQTLTPTDASPHRLNTLYMRYVTAGLSSAMGSRFNQSERRSSSVWWPIRAGLECRPIGAVLPACNARRYRWQYKRPAPSFLTLSFNDAVWSGAKTRPSSGMTSQRWHPVTWAWPISRSEWLIDLTYIQVRVIDWHVTVLVTGHLAADGAT